MLNHIYSILPLIIPGICFLLITIFYAITFKRRVAETYFLSCTTIILVLFLSGLLNFKGSLVLGYVILIAFSLFSFIFFVKAYLKNHKILKEILLIQGLLLMGVFLAFSLFLNYGRMLSIWDELTHWGSVIKNMYFLDALGTFKEASGSVGSYPPGISLFQYFLIRPFSEFTEFPAYIASNILFFSLITIFLKKFNLRNVLFLFTALLMPIFLLPISFTSIFVDSLLGILFGSIFLTYYSLDNEKYSIYRIVLISSIGVILTLIKDMGLVFSGIAYVIILVDIFFFQKNYTKEYILKGGTLFISKFKRFVFLLSPLLTTMTIRLTWTLHLKLTNAFPSSTNPGGSLTNLIGNFINGKLLPYQYETIANFKEAILRNPLEPLSFSAIELLIILVLLLIFISLTVKIISPSKKRLLFALLEAIIGGAFYIGFLLLLYLSIFSKYEAVNLASYSRYVLSYMIGIFFFFFIFILQESRLSTYKTISQKKFIYELKLVMSVLLIFFLYHFLLNTTLDNIKSNILQARDSVNKTILIREKYNKILIWKEYFSDPSNQPYLISQSDRGFDYFAIVHTLYPAQIEWRQDYSVALEPYYPELNDPWTFIITPTDWAEYVKKNYKFLYIFKFDQQFLDTYGSFFDKVESNALYKVTINDSGDLELISVIQ